MENERLKLPVGIQTFEDLRTEGYVYVDKTQYLVNLITTGKIYFLARPRRFGKSLTVSTFDAIFSGKKELFKGLYAEGFMNRPDFKTSPVIRLDMSKPITNHGIDELENSIAKQVRDVADRLDVALPDSNAPGSLLNDLIIRAAGKYSQKAVILLDEYDKPYTDFVNDPVMADRIRDTLRNFYVQIKANDEYIRFTFITGISKFAKLGVFSTLNTTTDISLMPQYAEICGYTEEEIIRYFPDYLEDTASRMKITSEALINRMRAYYNGFSFDGEAKARLYNPFSTLLFFVEKEWYSYWMESGSTKFIEDYMKANRLTVEQFRNMPISRDFAKSPGEIDTAPPHSFLYQSGYLTLRPGTSDDLSLDYPNTEVLNAMSTLVSKNHLRDKGEDYFKCRSDLLEGLMNLDCEQVIDVFNRLLASVPYDDYPKNARRTAPKTSNPKALKTTENEPDYSIILLTFLRGCGVVVFPEIHSNLGRSDLVIAHRGVAWVIEIKVARRGDRAILKAGEAFSQIEDRNYAKLYPKTVRIGLAVDNRSRQITEWKTG